MYLAAWVGTLLDQLGGVRWAGNGAAGAILLFLALEFGRQRRVIRVLLAVLVAIGLAAIAVAPEPWGVFWAAWRRGAAYAAFFLALGALREAAETSATVRRCGRQLIGQPAGRRYAAVTAGGHLFGIILSYGSIELLGAMVARGGAARGGAGVAARRRMLMGAYRGFAAMNCWSPLNIMTAVVSTAVPAADLRPLMPVGFVVSLGMMAAGWWLDRGERGEAGVTAASGEGWAVHLRVVGLVLLVMGLAEAVAAWGGVSLSVGVTAMVPAVGFGWIGVQVFRALRPRLALAMMGRRVARFVARVPSFRGEATVLAAGGFLGVALGAALPAGGLAAVVPGVPGLVVALGVPVVMTAAGLIGFNAIAVVAILGAAVPDPMAFGVSPQVFALACMLGWGVAVGLTPMSASALATARWTGSDPWTVTVRWNRGFTAVVMALVWGVLAAAYLVGLPKY